MVFQLVVRDIIALAVLALKLNCQLNTCQV